VVRPIIISLPSHPLAETVLILLAVVLVTAITCFSQPQWADHLRWRRLVRDTTPEQRVKITLAMYGLSPEEGRESQGPRRAATQRRGEAARTSVRTRTCHTTGRSPRRRRRRAGGGAGR
jgi:hypothetical protein